MDVDDHNIEHGEGWTFREGFEYEFSSLHPMSAHVDPPAIAAYETLLAKGPDGTGNPLIAESLVSDATNTKWTLRLRPDVRFHSGAPCDAASVAVALDVMRWQLGDGRQLWYWDAVDTVEVVDDQTLEFTLHHPSLRFPSLLWGTHTAIYNETLRQSSGENFGTKIVDGTGPYRLDSWSPEKITLERWSEFRPRDIEFMNPAGHGQPDRIEWHAIPDGHERLAQFEAGQLDCIHAPPPSEVARLLKDSQYQSYAHPQASNMYLSLDWKHELGFADLRIRRAVSLAIDRQSIVEQVFHGHASPTWGPLPPGHDYYDPSVNADNVFDPRRAIALLDDVGWVLASESTRTRDGARLVIRCVIQDDETFRQVGAKVKEQLAAVGVGLELDFIPPFADFYGALNAGAPAAISKWLWQDPMDALIGFTSTETAPFPNWANASSERLDDAFSQWIRATDEVQLQAAATAAQKAFVDDLPYIPILTPDDVWIWQKNAVGFNPFARTLYPSYHSLGRTAG